MTQPIRHRNVTVMPLQCYFMPQLHWCDTYFLTNMRCLIQITIGLLMKNHFDSCLNQIRKQGSGGAISNSLTEKLMICIHCTGRSLTHFPRSEEKSVYCWSIQGWRGDLRAGSLFSMLGCGQLCGKANISCNFGFLCISAPQLAFLFLPCSN